MEVVIRRRKKERNLLNIKMRVCRNSLNSKIEIIYLQLLDIKKDVKKENDQFTKVMMISQMNITTIILPEN